MENHYQLIQRPRFLVIQTNKNNPLLNIFIIKLQISHVIQINMKKFVN